MGQVFQPQTTARVTKAWQAMYSDPIDVVAGEALILGKVDPEWPGWQWCTDPRGKSGWVPISYITDSDGKSGKIRSDYVARELNLKVGDVITLCQLESGWYWARNCEGAEGWIPGTHVRI